MPALEMLADPYAETAEPETPAQAPAQSPGQSAQPMLSDVPAQAPQQADPYAATAIRPSAPAPAANDDPYAATAIQAPPSAQAGAPQGDTNQPMLRPHTPTLMEQLRDTVANSAIGHSLHQAVPKLADALNLNPSEAMDSPDYQRHDQQLLSPEYLAPSVQNALAHPLAAAGQMATGLPLVPPADPTRPHTANDLRAEGALRAAGGLTTPGNLALGALTGGAASMLGDLAPAAASTLMRLASAGFTVDMLHGLYQQSQAYKQAVDSGNLDEAHRIQGSMGVNGVLALLSGAHAVRPHVGARAGAGEPAQAPPPPAPTPSAEAESPAAAPPDSSRSFTAAATSDVMAARRAQQSAAAAQQAGETVPPTPELAALGREAENKPLKVGSTEPETGRDVLHPTDNPVVLDQAAQAAAPELSARLGEALQGVEGAKLDAVRPHKSPERTLEKLTREGQPAETIPDYVAARVVVDSPAARDAAVAAIKRQFDVVRDEDKFADGDDTYGYRRRALQVRMSNGITAEVHVVPREVAAINVDEHDLYKTAREAELNGQKSVFEQAAADAKAQNDAAMEKFNQRNGIEPEKQTKYKFGSTQANVPPESEAHAGLEAARLRIADADQAGKGKDIGGNHVTVRYGLKGEDSAAIEQFLRAQKPFEATLAKTSTFPPSPNSDGAAVIKADVQSPEFVRLNAEIEKHGDFKPSDFDYHPHATVAYVKPEAAAKYVGMPETEGKKFQVRSIAISDRDGTLKEIPLEGGKSETEGGRGKSPEPAAAAGAQAPAVEPNAERRIRPGDTMMVRGSKKFPDGTVVEIAAWNMFPDERGRPINKGRGWVAQADGRKVATGTLSGSELTPIEPVRPLPAKTQTPREAEFTARAVAEGPRLVGEYIRKNTQDGVLYIGTDQAKQLFPEYVADPTGTNYDVSAAAASVAEAVWQTALKTPPEPGREWVMLAMGSPASGKTEGLLGSHAGAEALRPGIQREMIPQETAYLERVLAETLRSGRKPQMEIVFTDDPAKNVQRMVARAKQEGRPVRIDYMAKAYVTTPKVVADVAARYGSKLMVVAVDNSGAKGEATTYNGIAQPAVDATSRWTEQTAREAMDAELERLHNAGEVPDAIYRASKGPADGASGYDPGRDQAGGSVRAGLRQQPEPERPAGNQGQLAPAQGEKYPPGFVGRVPLSELQVDPKRFQYKLNIDASGVTSKLKEVSWNDALADSITVWRDPEDGKLYVVNGHHRYELAARGGAKDLAVKVLDADVQTAKEARTVGALQNIAAGTGTAVDAAKFMRDSQMPPEQMKDTGIALTGPIADGGVALAKLDPSIFDEVVAGRVPEKQGIAIGKAAETPAQQEELLKAIRQADAKGKPITGATLDELVRQVKMAGETEVKQDSLFGPETRSYGLALQVAEVSSYVRRKILTEKRLFGGLTSATKAEALKAADNTISTAKNKTVADKAAEAAELYDRLSARTGPVYDVLKRAAQELANGAKDGPTKERAYDDIRKALGATLQGRVESGKQGVSETERSGQAGPGASRPAQDQLASPGEKAKPTAQQLATDLRARGKEVATGREMVTGELGGEEKKPSRQDLEDAGQKPMFSREDRRDRELGFAETTVVPASGSDVATVQLGEPLRDALNEMEPELAAGGKWSGAALPKSFADRIVEKLRLKAADTKTGWMARGALGRLADAIDAARDKGGNAILHTAANEGSAAEEQFHGFQLRQRAAFAEVLMSVAQHPAMAKARWALRRQGYSGDNPTILHEATAKVFNGDWRGAGLTRDEGASLLSEFLNAVVKARGAEALDDLPNVPQAIADVIGETRRRNGRNGRQAEVPEQERGGAATATRDRAQAPAVGEERDERGAGVPGGRDAGRPAAEDRPGDGGEPRPHAGQQYSFFKRRDKVAGEEVEHRLLVTAEEIRQASEASFRDSDQKDAKRDRMKELADRERDRQRTGITVGENARGPADKPAPLPLEKLRKRVAEKPNAKRTAKEVIAETVAESKRHAERDLKLGLDALSKARTNLQKGWETLRKPPPTTDYNKTLGAYELARTESALEQQKLADELVRKVPSRDRREAMSNWIQANGDVAKLRYWAEQSKPELARGYRLALELTDAEKEIAQAHKDYFDEQEREAKRAGFIERGKAEYLMQIYEGGKNNGLQSLVNFAALKDDPGIFERSSFRNYFEAESAGHIPKNKDLGWLTATYDKVFTEAVRSRAFIRSLLETRERDGRPTAVLRRDGQMMQIGPENEPYLMSYEHKEDGADPLRADYVKVDHPVMRGWLWQVGDLDLDEMTPKEVQMYNSDKGVALRGDVWVHPDVADKLKTMLSTSAVKKTPVLRELLWTSQMIKSLMFTASGTHQVIESTQAVMRGVSPINLDAVKKTVTLKGFANPFHLDDKILELDSPDKRLLISNGLMLTDFSGEEAWSLGVGSGPLKYVGPAARPLAMYHDFLFHDLIPKLKMSMALKALKYNRLKYSGSMDADAIAEMTARQANQTFGGINWRRMGVSPTTVDLARLVVLAPDFQFGKMMNMGDLVRARGGYQRMVFLRGALLMYATARALNALLNQGDAKWDKDEAFALVYHGKKYAIRTEYGDALSLLTDPQKYAMHRLNPLLGRTALELATRKDEFGRAKTPLQALGDTAKGAVPISLQGALKNQDIDWQQSFLSAMGVTDSKYYTPAEEEAHKLRIAHLPESPEEEDTQTREARHLKDDLRSGKKTNTDLWNAVQAGKITPQQAGKIQREAQMTKLEEDVKALPLKEAMDVYEKANVVERRDLQPILGEKAQKGLEGLYEKNPEQASQQETRLEKLLSEKL